MLYSTIIAIYLDQEKGEEKTYRDAIKKYILKKMLKNRDNIIMVKSIRPKKINTAQRKSFLCEIREKNVLSNNVTMERTGKGETKRKVQRICEFGKNFKKVSVFVEKTCKK